jgi:hypothetical protein
MRLVRLRLNPESNNNSSSYLPGILIIQGIEKRLKFEVKTYVENKTNFDE